MPLEEPQTHREWIEVWKLTHTGLWQRCADTEANERLLLEGTERYGRPCQAAVDRAFQDIRSSLVSADYAIGKDGRCEIQPREARTGIGA